MSRADRAILVTAQMVAIAAVLFLAVVARAEAPALSELDALRIEVASLRVQLLRWEAAEAARRLEAAAKARDAAVADVRPRGLDPSLCIPDVGTRRWVCREAK